MGRAQQETTVDLTQRAAVTRAFVEGRPDVVLHLAACVGGIGANEARPATFFYENAMMGLQLIDEARHHGVEKLVLLGSVCAYPKATLVPFIEDDLWLGYPEETNAPYGIAKRMLIVQAQAYRQQYGLRSIVLLPANLYGPGDHDDPARSHVIPALIRKLIKARDADLDRVVVWGDGRATRGFLYIDDAVRAIVLAAERWDGTAPVNVGSGHEVSIVDSPYYVGARSSGHCNSGR